MILPLIEYFQTGIQFLFFFRQVTVSEWSTFYRIFAWGLKGTSSDQMVPLW